MFGRGETRAFDVNRLVASAVDAFLQVDSGSENGSDQGRRDHRIGTLGSIALGVTLAAGARAAYSRARRLDIQEVAEKVEERLSA